MNKKGPVYVSSPAPIDDGGRKYNVVTLAAAAIGAVIGLVSGGLEGLAICALVGAMLGYITEATIVKVKWYGLREMKFAMGHPAEKTVLFQRLVQGLTPMGMTVEMNTDGMPVISYQTLIYEINLNEDQTFTIWWRKSLARAFFCIDILTVIPNYRKTVVAMGMIAYHIQQISMEQMPVGASAADIDNTEAASPKACPKCGTPAAENEKFCMNCGTELSQYQPGGIEERQGNHKEEEYKEPGKQMRQTETENVNGKRRYTKKRYIILGLCVIFFLIIMLSDSNQYVEMIRSGHYGEDWSVTVGEAFDRRFKDGEWSEAEDTAYEGLMHVYFEGNDTESGTHWRVVFNIEENDTEFEVSAIFIDGEHFFGTTEIYYLMNYIYTGNLNQLWNDLGNVIGAAFLEALFGSY